MESYSQLADVLKRADDGWRIFGPQPASRIDEVERKHNIRLPGSYRRFLMEVGGIEYPNHAYTGIDDDYLHPSFGFMRHTEAIRTQYGLPAGLLVLESDHDLEELACLDLNSMKDGECPVVWFHVYTGEVVGKCANSFDEFFRQLVERWRE